MSPAALSFLAHSGIAVLGCCFGDSFGGDLGRAVTGAMQGLLGSALSDMVKGTKMPFTENSLREPNGDLHRALARAISKAARDVELEDLIRDATGSLAALEAPAHGELEVEVMDFLRQLERNPEKVYVGPHIANGALKAFLEQPDRTTFGPVAHLLGEEYMPGLDDATRERIFEAIHLKIAARFWDEVKHDDAAWRAYAAAVFAAAEDRAKALAKGQEEMLVLLEKQREWIEGIPAQADGTAGIPAEVAGEIGKVTSLLDEGFAAVHGDLAEILARVGKVAMVVERVDSKVDGVQVGVDEANAGIGAVHAELRDFRDDFTRREGDRPAAILHQLPPGAETFFGRGKELSELTARIREGKSTSVLGPAGMGKTALAARALADVFGGGVPNDLCKQMFPHGIVYVDLYALRARAEDFWNALANRLMGPEFLPKDTAESRARNACPGRHFLLIIEGAEEANGKDGQASLGTLLGVLCADNRKLILTRDSTQTVAGATVKVEDRLVAPHDGELFDKLAGKKIPAKVRNGLLDLLEGHPLAITWAASLLERDDEDPQYLAREWTAKGFPPLQDPDPERATHTLEWLFRRSEGVLPPEALRVLEAAGLLARAPFPLALLDGLPEAGDVRAALRRLVQLGLLRRFARQDQDGADEGPYWEFTHVLGYQFARKEKSPDEAIRLHLGEAMAGEIRRMLEEIRQVGDPLPLQDTLLHAAALLAADAGAERQVLGRPLAGPLLYDIWGKLNDFGRLALERSAVICAVGWLEGLPLATGGAPGWQGYLALGHRRLGQIAIIQGDLGVAASYYERNLAILEKLAKSDPGNSQWQIDLANSYRQFGHIALYRGNLSMARPYYEQGLAILEKLVQADPGNAGRQWNLSALHCSLGDVASEEQDFVLASRHYEQTLAITSKLAGDEPGNAVLQKDLATIHDLVGNISLARGDFAMASHHYGQGLGIREEFAKTDPSNAWWQRDLYLSYCHLAEMAHCRADTISARSYFEKGLATMERLALGAPTNAEWQRDLSVCHHNLAVVAEARGDYAESVEQDTKAHDVLESMRTRGMHLSPNDLGVLRRLKEMLSLPPLESS